MDSIGGGIRSLVHKGQRRISDCPSKRDRASRERNIGENSELDGEGYVYRSLERKDGQEKCNRRRDQNTKEGLRGPD